MIRKSVVFDVLLILCISFFSAQANADDEQFVEHLTLADESMCHEPNEYDEEEVTPVKDKKFDFYVSANSGKIYHDNSETFMNGIKAIGERVHPMVKKIFPDEFESIQQFNGKIDFRWLNSISVGYYTRENGRIDFETMYSKVNIENGNSPSVFDRSANVFAFLLNVYYNPSIQDTQFAPYIGLGIGPTILRLRKINESSQNSMPLNVPWFAYQVKLGINYSIISEVKALLGYRYFSIPVPIADDISTHNIEIGLIFNF
ncbi:P44/Msp2 family outer membrane protein [Wolbachia endosymbiont of Atemnus politus]|nr:P44/Msp2 family outer membrane protein [Wolbachia endosymbiont of Atemnus politus]